MALTPLQTFSICFFIFSTISSLLAYLLVLFILIRYYKEFKSHFYCIVISLGIADMGYLALILCYAVPCTILQTDVWSSVPYAPGFIEQISYLTECTHLTYIGINRLAYACASGSKHPYLDKIFNNRLAIAFWIVLLWATGVVIPVLARMAGCDLIYDHATMAFVYVCNATSIPFTSQVMLADNFMAGFMPALIAATHLLAWLVIYGKGRRSNGSATQEIVQQGKRERRLLIQFTLISSILILYYASFWAIPYWCAGSPGLVVINYIGVINTAINPFTYLAFNKLMKAKSRYLIFDVLLKRYNTVQDTSVVRDVRRRQTETRA